MSELLAQAKPELVERYAALDAFLMALGDDVTMKTNKTYFAYRRIKNFACVEVHPNAGTLLVYLKVDPATIELEDGFSRDVRSIGHFGTGDLELRLKAARDLERAEPLIRLSYDAS